MPLTLTPDGVQETDTPTSFSSVWGDAGEDYVKKISSLPSSTSHAGGFSPDDMNYPHGLGGDAGVAESSGNLLGVLAVQAAAPLQVGLEHVALTRYPDGVYSQWVGGKAGGGLLQDFGAELKNIPNNGPSVGEMRNALSHVDPTKFSGEEGWSNLSRGLQRKVNPQNVADLFDHSTGASHGAAPFAGKFHQLREDKLEDAFRIAENLKSSYVGNAGGIPAKAFEKEVLKQTGFRLDELGDIEKTLNLRREGKFFKYVASSGSKAEQDAMKAARLGSGSAVAKTPGRFTGAVGSRIKFLSRGEAADIAKGAKFVKRLGSGASGEEKLLRLGVQAAKSATPELAEMSRGLTLLGKMKPALIAGGKLFGRVLPILGAVLWVTSADSRKSSNEMLMFFGGYHTPGIADWPGPDLWCLPTTTGNSFGVDDGSELGFGGYMGMMVAGAASGALNGSLAGPPGAVAGAIVGAAGGAIMKHRLEQREAQIRECDQNLFGDVLLPQFNVTDKSVKNSVHYWNPSVDNPQQYKESLPSMLTALTKQQKHIVKLAETVQRDWESMTRRYKNTTVGKFVDGMASSSGGVNVVAPDVARMVQEAVLTMGNIGELVSVFNDTNMSIRQFIVESDTGMIPFLGVGFNGEAQSLMADTPAAWRKALSGIEERSADFEPVETFTGGTTTTSRGQSNTEKPQVNVGGGYAPPVGGGYTPLPGSSTENFTKPKQGKKSTSSVNDIMDKLRDAGQKPGSGNTKTERTTTTTTGGNTTSDATQGKNPGRNNTNPFNTGYATRPTMPQYSMPNYNSWGKPTIGTNKNQFDDIKKELNDIKEKNKKTKENNKQPLGKDKPKEKGKENPLKKTAEKLEQEKKKNPTKPMKPAAPEPKKPTPMGQHGEKDGSKQKQKTNPFTHNTDSQQGKPQTSVTHNGKTYEMGDEKKATVAKTMLSNPQTDLKQEYAKQGYTQASAPHALTTAQPGDIITQAHGKDGLYLGKGMMLVDGKEVPITGRATAITMQADGNTSSTAAANSNPTAGNNNPFTGSQNSTHTVATGTPQNMNSTANPNAKNNPFAPGGTNPFKQ